MALAFLHPMGYRHPFRIVRGVFCDLRRIVFQLPRGGRKRIVLRVLIEVIESRRNLVQFLLFLTGHHKDLPFPEFLPGHIFLAAGGLIEETYPFLFAHIPSIGRVVLRPQLLRHLGADIKITEGFSHWRTTGLLQINGSKVTGGHIIAQIIHLMLGHHWEDNIRKIAIIFQPGMLGHDALDGRILEGLHGQIAVIPAGGLTGRVGPNHMDPTEARPWILHLLELILLGG